MPSYPTPRSKKTLIDPDEQLFLALAIKHAPLEVREHGLQEIHSFPLVSRGKGFAVIRKPARMAWRRYQEIELRTPNSFPAMIFDCDSQPQDYLAVAFGALVRPPNWIVSNPETGHAHIVYCLARPVLHGDGVRQKPLRWRQRIAEFYRMVYGADSGYAGVLTHNPVHPKWDVTWWREEPWTLPELAEVIPRAGGSRASRRRRRAATSRCSTLRYAGSVARRIGRRARTWATSTRGSALATWSGSTCRSTIRSATGWPSRCARSAAKTWRAARHSGSSSPSRRPRAGCRARCGAKARCSNWIERLGKPRAYPGRRGTTTNRGST